MRTRMIFRLSHFMFRVNEHGFGCRQYLALLYVRTGWAWIFRHRLREYLKSFFRYLTRPFMRLPIVCILGRLSLSLSRTWKSALFYTTTSVASFALFWGIWRKQFLVFHERLCEVVTVIWVGSWPWSWYDDQALSTSVILFLFRVVSHHFLPIPRPFPFCHYYFPMSHACLLSLNCYIDLICYLDVDSVTGDGCRRECLLWGS